MAKGHFTLVSIDNGASPKEVRKIAKWIRSLGCIVTEEWTNANILSVVLNDEHFAQIEDHPQVRVVSEYDPDAISSQLFSPTAVQTQAVPTTPAPNGPWHLDRVSQRELPLDGSFHYTWNGEGVRVYVLDTGVRATHQDFDGRVIDGFDPTYEHVKQYNPSYYTNLGINSNPKGKHDGHTLANGHGTPVASIIAGTTYGIAKAATIVPVVIYNDNANTQMGSATKNLLEVAWNIEIWDWLIDNHPPGTAGVVNWSGGWVTTFHNTDASFPWLREAMLAFVEAHPNVPIIMAASNYGYNNSGSDTTKAPRPQVWAGEGWVFSVGTVHWDDGKAEGAPGAGFYSNHGPLVALYAGTNRTVAATKHSDTAASPSTIVGLSGTSYSAPAAAGVAATWVQQYPNVPAIGIYNALVDTSTKDVITELMSEEDHNRLLFLPERIVYAESHITGNINTPANALGAPNGIFTGNTELQSFDSRFAMESPEENFPVRGVQRVVVRCRKQTNRTGTPTIGIQLFQNGVPLSPLETYPITSSVFQDVTLSLDTEIDDPDNVEVRLVGTHATGISTVRTSVQVDSISWLPAYQIAPRGSDFRVSGGGQVAVEGDHETFDRSGNFSITGKGSVYARGLADWPVGAPAFMWAGEAVLWGSEPVLWGLPGFLGHFHVTGGGSVEVTGDHSSSPAAFRSFSITGGGSVAASGSKGAAHEFFVTGKGKVEVNVVTHRVGNFGVSGGGSVFVSSEIGPGFRGKTSLVQGTAVTSVALVPSKSSVTPVATRTHVTSGSTKTQAQEAY